jgi:peptidyl-prolyl cis-trans isomerase B (cyclophilin B)
MSESSSLPSSAAPGAVAPQEGEEVVVISTNCPEGDGEIIVSFRPDKAPGHVAQFKKLAGLGFYDGIRFHRCIDGFMIQGGDPNSKDLAQARMWGTGGYEEDGREVRLKAEFTDYKHTRGVLSAARSQNPDSASSQFFIMHQDARSLDGQYSAYGIVIKGMDVVDAIVKTGDRMNNGAVHPSDAVLVNKMEVKTWPLA